MTKKKNFDKFTEMLRAEENTHVRQEFVQTTLLIFSVPVLFFSIARSDLGALYMAHFDPGVNTDMFAALIAVAVLHVIIFRYVWRAM